MPDLVQFMAEPTCRTARLRITELIRRGQESGDLDATLPPGWLLTACLALGRAAEEEVKAGRMTIDEATHAVHRSFLRLLGLADAPHG